RPGDRNSTGGDANMNKRRTMLAALAALLALGPAAHAGVGWSIGLNFGVPVYHRPCWGPYWGYYRPYPIYVAPPPVVVQPGPVAQPVYVAPPTAPAPAPGLLAPPTTARAARPVEGEVVASDLTSADERTRAAAMVERGRRKDAAAVGALTKALQEDQSPVVREAAARGLGLIGSPAALPALQHAAQADDDRDVRRSASFAADVLRANLRR